MRFAVFAAPRSGAKSGGYKTTALRSEDHYENVRPARRTVKTIGRLDHWLRSRKVGINREFSKEFDRRGGPRFFRPLLYRQSYLGTLCLPATHGPGRAEVARRGASGPSTRRSRGRRCSTARAGWAAGPASTAGQGWIGQRKSRAALRVIVISPAAAAARTAEPDVSGRCAVFQLTTYTFQKPP